MTDYSSDLIALVKPFDARLIHSKGGSYAADYVSHAVVEQRLIAALGCPPDFRMREVVRDASGEVVGVICRMDALIGMRLVSVEEAGDADPGQGPDASPLKNALSDAYKRCALRLGVGLHLWAGEDFTLYKHMVKASEGGKPPTGDTRAAEAPSASVEAKSSPPPSSPASTSETLAFGEGTSGSDDAAEGRTSKAAGFKRNHASDPADTAVQESSPEQQPLGAK